MKEDRNVIGYFPRHRSRKRRKDRRLSRGPAPTTWEWTIKERSTTALTTMRPARAHFSSEVAQALGPGHHVPASSVAFLWVAGEEKGLLGSQWFADHMNLPTNYKIVADINLDMVSRNDSKKIGVTPSPKHGDYNSLIPIAQSSCKTEGMEVVFDADQYYFRTDSYSFARKGIPIIFFFSGIHADYHRPTDDIEKADLEKAGRMTRAAYRLGWQVAPGTGHPRRSKSSRKKKAGPTITSK